MAWLFLKYVLIKKENLWKVKVKVKEKKIIISKFWKKGIENFEILIIDNFYIDKIRFSCVLPCFFPRNYKVSYDNNIQENYYYYR